MDVRIAIKFKKKKNEVKLVIKWIEMNCVNHQDENDGQKKNINRLIIVLKQN